MNENELKVLLKVAEPVGAGGGSLVEVVRGKLLLRRKRLVMVRVVMVLMMTAGGITALRLLPSDGGKPVAVDVPKVVPTPHPLISPSSTPTSPGERGLEFPPAPAGVDVDQELARVLAVADEREAIERAAGAVVRLGDQYASMASMHGEARDIYTDVVKRYPETIAAEMARAGIAKMEIK